jgi:hypothetical protein
MNPFINLLHIGPKRRKPRAIKKKPPAIASIIKFGTASQSGLLRSDPSGELFAEPCYRKRDRGISNTMAEGVGFEPTVRRNASNKSNSPMKMDTEKHC